MHMIEHFNSDILITYVLNLCDKNKNHVGSSPYDRSQLFICIELYYCS